MSVKNDKPGVLGRVRWHQGKIPYQVQFGPEMLTLWGPKDVLIDRLRLVRLVLEQAEKELTKVPSLDVEVQLPLEDIIP